MLYLIKVYKEEQNYDSSPYGSPIVIESNYNLTIHLIGDNYICHPPYGDNIMTEGNLTITADKGATLNCDAPINCNVCTQNSGYVKTSVSVKGNGSYYWAVGCKGFAVSGGTFEASRIGKGCALAIWTNNYYPKVPQGTILYEGENGFDRRVTNFSDPDSTSPWLETVYCIKIVSNGEDDNTSLAGLVTTTSAATVTAKPSETTTAATTSKAVTTTSTTIFAANNESIVSSEVSESSSVTTAVMTSYETTVTTSETTDVTTESLKQTETSVAKINEEVIQANTTGEGNRSSDFNAIWIFAGCLVLAVGIVIAAIIIMRKK